MTADELASFRALLRAQVEAPPRRALFFAARGHAASAAPAPPTLAVEAEAPVLLLPQAAFTLGLKVADPPPHVPPLFGRRDVEALLQDTAEPTAAEPPRSPPSMRRAGVAEHVWEVPPAACDEPARSHRPPTAPGGWSRARPPSAERRLLARLEAVFLAERMGLDARREAKRG